MATTPTQDHEVKLVYLQGQTVPNGTEGSKYPSTFTADTIYVMPDKQAIYVGDTLIVDRLGGSVRGVTITGEGNNISNASFDSVTGTLTLTKSNLPTLSENATTKTATLKGGDTFTVTTDISVSDHTITDEATTFTLPDIVGAVAKKSGTEGTLEVTTNGTTADVEVFADGTFMKATNGTATGASITLAADPIAELGAATKQYVDNKVSGLSGAMHFIGTSSTALTDGGTEAPTISGTVKPIAGLKAGDVVVYSGLEFLWDADGASGHWRKLGDEASYALKTLEIIPGTGLSGGGDLQADVTISHQAAPSTGSAASATAGAAPTNLVAVTGVTIDELGHVAGVTTGDFATQIGDAIDAKIEALDYTEDPTGDYVTRVSETNGVIAVTKASKGSVASGNTGLVDGGTVYTAIDNAKLKWTVLPQS